MIKNKFYTAIATCFYIGKIPFAPGTFGSLFAVLIWVLFNHFFAVDLTLWVPFLVVLTILGISSADFYSKKIGKDDAGEIVIDEVCGQLVTFLVAGIFMDIAHNYLLIFLGFLLFRLFDITKPFVIGLADKNVKGGFGVMLDDLLAGFAAAVVLYAVYAFVLN